MLPALWHTVNIIIKGCKVGRSFTANFPRATVTRTDVVRTDKSFPAAHTSPCGNTWDNPIKGRPQLVAVTMTEKEPGGRALRIKEDHVKLLLHKMQRRC